MFTSKRIATMGGDVFRDEYSLAFDGSNEYVDFTSTGFQPKGVSNYNNNSLNQTYIYMAFATS